MAHFRNDFPDLDESEYRFASYCFAGLDNISVMNLLNFKSKDVVYTKRARLRIMISSSESKYKEQYIF